MFLFVLWRRLFPALHVDKIMIGDIMLLIPGLMATNAIRDILIGDTISGVMSFYRGNASCSSALHLDLSEQYF